MSPQSAAAVVVAETDLLSEDDMVPRDTRVEHLLHEWNLSYELEPAFTLAKIKIEDGVQIRLETHRAPATTVDQYITHMKHGAIFPPIILASPQFLVDGNTRMKAALALHRKTFPAYVVKFPHLGMAKMIGAAVNQLGGDRLSEPEIVVAAEAMMREAYADEAIARTLGRSVTHIRNIRKDNKFQESLARTGIGTVQLPKALRRELADITHDEPFKAAVELVTRVKPAVKDVGTLVDRIKQTHSDAEALATIQAVETQWGPVTGPPPVQKSTTRSQAKKGLAQAKALLAIAEANPTEMVLANDQEAHDVWKRLSAVVTQVLAFYVKP